MISGGKQWRCKCGRELGYVYHRHLHLFENSTTKEIAIISASSHACISCPCGRVRRWAPIRVRLKQ